MKKFLDMIINQIDRLESKYELIEYFHGRENQASIIYNRDDREKFWSVADVMTKSLKVKVVFNSFFMDYTLYLLNFVPKAVSEAHENWMGVMSTHPGTSNIRKLRDFLNSALLAEENK